MLKILNWLKAEWVANKVVTVLLIIFSVVLFYYISWKKDSSNTQYVYVPQIQEVVRWKIKTVQVPIEGGKVVVLDKESVIKRVPGLPDSFTKDPKKQVTSTGEIKPSEGGTAVLNIIDTGSGVSEIFAKQRPVSFFAFESKGEAGIRGGYSDKGKEVNVYGQENLLRIGTVHAGVYVEGSYRPNEKDEFGGKVMISVSKHW